MASVVQECFERKPIAELVAEGEGKLKRALGVRDLIALSIGAVIGAGIFGSIGTATAGQLDAAGHVIRSGAGPAVIFSFILSAFACALAGLCYAELSAMIPQAGSAYAYSYATLGELVAWIIGWDLILEYAVGNVAVAINWAGYFRSLLGGIGLAMPEWLCTGYRTALLSPDPAIHGMLNTAPHVFGIPILLNVPAFGIVALITCLLLLGVRESARVNNGLVLIKLIVLALFVFAGFSHIHRENYHPFAPNGFTGIHHGAAIIFFAYIGFDAISTAAEETKNPQRNMPLGILLGLGLCTVIYIIVGTVLVGHGSGGETRRRRSPRRGAPGIGDVGRGQPRLARGHLRAGRRAARLPIRTAAHLLRDGARWTTPEVGIAHPSPIPHAVGDDDRDRHLRRPLVADRRCR